MPYERHPSLKTPPDRTVLWRYMDFARFIDMLENRALWFSRLDQLEDPLEGLHTDAELTNIRKHVEKESAEQILRVFRVARRELYVNCWREGRSESLAMWDLYGRGSGIVAVKTTVGRLKAALSMHQAPVFVSKLRYIDWNRAHPGLDNVLVACSRKDASYEHEAEVRVIIMDFKEVRRGRWRPLGVRVNVALEEMISEVVVGPREQGWVLELVNQIMNRYSLSRPVVASDRLKPRR